MLSDLSKPKKILILAGVLLAVFLILDFGYFAANIRFLFFKPKNPVAAQIPTRVRPNLLGISSLGISVPVLYATGTTEQIFQADLINGVVHYPGTAAPGQPGNCYIFGHSSDFIWSKGHYKNVFAVLPRIAKGAEINISDQNGKEFTYIVTASHEVATNDTAVLGQGGFTKKLLTLQTSYPVGTALARWVVVAELK